MHTQGLLRLPNELLVQILQSLCLHCRLPHVVDCSAAVLEHGRVEQRALAYLSRTSKRLRDVAQPVLFHYFHTGIEPDEPLAGERYRDDYDTLRWGSLSHQKKEMRLMQSFIRALLHKPQLAGAVKALALYATEVENDLKLQRHEAEALGRQVMARLDIPHSASDSFWTFGLAHLQSIAIALAPDLVQLLIDSPPSWPVFKLERLSSIRFLVLPGLNDGLDQKSESHIQSYSSFLPRLNHLESLTTNDCDGLRDYRELDLASFFEEKAQRAATLFPQLRQIRMSGYLGNFLPMSLPLCEELVDLELYHIQSPCFPIPLDYLDKCRTKLRRFRYIVCRQTAYAMREYRPFGADCFDDIFYENVLQALAHSRIYHWFQFQSFPALEIIDMEQGILHGRQFDEYRRKDWPPWPGEPEQYELDWIEERRKPSAPLVTRLPPCLRWLRIRGILLWAPIFEDMLAVAEAGSELSSLSHVMLEVLLEPPPEEVQVLKTAFAAVDIVCDVVRMRPGIHDAPLPGLLPDFRAGLMVDTTEEGLREAHIMTLENVSYRR